METETEALYRYIFLQQCKYVYNTEGIVTDKTPM